MRYQLYREQQLNCDVETAWDFFSSPHNLSKLTPKNMGFQVHTKDIENRPIYVGMEIDYTVKPLFNIPLKWKTEITQVQPLKSFTDFQSKGPFKYWNHFHEFIPNNNGILMRDTVDYELPFSFIGNIVHSLIVRKKLEDIFEFRYKFLTKFF